MLKSSHKDGPWAYEACKLSREIIEDVLEYYPSTEYVEREIISLLKKFVKPIEAMKIKPDDSFVNYTSGFLKNINWRISKLEKYVAGLPIVTRSENTSSTANNQE
jgi:hypothetical protein